MPVSYQQPPSHHQQPYQQYPPQQPPPATNKVRNWPWILLMIVGAVVILGVIVAITNPDPTTGSSPADDTATPAATPAAEVPAKPTGPARTMADGVYQVGVDVQAGRYKTPGPPDGGLGICYWSRAKDDSGEFESIIANGTPQGPGSVSVNKGEFVELSGDCTWTKVG